MSLSDAKVGTAIAVTDIERAKQFYEGKLGLTSGGEDPDGGCTYACGEGTEVHVFPSPNAGGTGATVAAFIVDDLEASVDELTANSVVFEQYGPPISTDERGISALASSAWFRDPDGNTLALVRPD